MDSLLFSIFALLSELPCEAFLFPAFCYLL
uniref:Uncharacterized protein n=1 Tax=Anguilla anguilla TaxID=7936 RepID=A0A0E9XYC7_ANGAN